MPEDERIEELKNYHSRQGWEDQQIWVLDILDSESEEQLLEKCQASYTSGILCRVLVVQEIDRASLNPVRYIGLAFSPNNQNLSMKD